MCPNICGYANLRVGKQRLREARVQAIDYLILLLAGASLGSLSKASDEQFGMPGYTYTIIAVCKLKRSITSHSMLILNLLYWLYQLNHYVEL